MDWGAVALQGGYAGSGATQADWDVVPWLRRQMAPVPRVAVNQALTDPASYLQCRCCQGQGRALAATMPDLCVAYKLHTECGKLINLYDWMVSFDAVLSKVGSFRSPLLSQCRAVTVTMSSLLVKHSILLASFSVEIICRQ